MEVRNEEINEFEIMKAVMLFDNDGKARVRTQ
jgi:hypothetical protein